MSDERRKDPVMRQRIEELQADLNEQSAAVEADRKAVAEDRKRLTALGIKLNALSNRLNKLMWSGLVALAVAAGALTYLGFKLDDRGDEQGKLAKENATLVNKLNAEIQRNQRQRQKSATNACLTRREQNATLIRAFVPDEIVALATKRDRDILAGPDDCEAYGKSVTTDRVPPPKRGTNAEAQKKGKK